MPHLININKIYLLATQTQANGQPVEFDITFIKLETGAIVSGRCICTSYYFHNRTMNLKFVDSGQFRKIRTITIIEFNHTETFI